MTRHPKADEIARCGAGALVQRQATKVGMHVDGCPECRKTRERISAVRQALAAASYPPVPDLVGSEIGLALAIETAQRNIPDTASRHTGFKREPSHGVARSAAGLVQFAHLAWAYHDNEELAARVFEYAEDGIAAGQYVELVGLGSMEGASWTVQTGDQQQYGAPGARIRPSRNTRHGWLLPTSWRGGGCRGISSTAGRCVCRCACRRA